jgi:signal peptidase I
MKKIYFFLIFSLIFMLSTSIVYANTDSITFDINIDGDQISVTDSSWPLLDSDTSAMDDMIMEYSANQTADIYTNTDSFKQRIKNIAKTYGYSYVTVNINSKLDDGSLPLISQVDGTSMEPTLHNGDTILINRTQKIKVGDIVVCNDTQYGLLVKRVGEVEGNNIYLQSDNKSKEVVYRTDGVYVEEGLHKWVSLDRIFGVVKFDLSKDSSF